MFNLKKAQSEYESPQNNEGRLEGTIERENSLKSGDHGNVDWLLRDVRKDDAPTGTIEFNLKKVREANKTPTRLTENQLDESETSEGQVPHRVKGIDDIQMKPLDALNAAQEAEQVRAFNERGAKTTSTDFWDKYVGTQMDGTPTKVPVQVPCEGNQLQNDFDRLKSLTPEQMGKHDKVRKMVMASMRDADAMLFYVYHRAAVENRNLNDEEKVIVTHISEDKAKLIKSLI
jgi:hypothetical protein